MKTQLFRIPAVVTTVQKEKVVTLNHKEKVPQDDSTSEQFEEKMVSKMAQQVAEFNRVEMETIKQMGDGEYVIDYKIII